MHEHMRTLLNAYLDGELQGIRLVEMKNHLATCKTCRDELKELRNVSELLKTGPEPEFLPAGRFAANLALRLPRREKQATVTKGIGLAWWLAPAGLMAVWFFVRTVFTLTDVTTMAQLSGLLGQASNWLGANQATSWFSAAVGLFGGQAATGQATLVILNTLNVLGDNLLDGFLWQALIALLYWGWLGAMWLKTRQAGMNMKTEM